MDNGTIGMFRLSVCQHCHRCWSPRRLPAHVLLCQVALGEAVEVAPAAVINAVPVDVPALEVPNQPIADGEPGVAAAEPEHGAVPVPVAAIAAAPLPPPPVVPANVDMGAFSVHEDSNLLMHLVSLADTPLLDFGRISAAARQEFRRCVETVCNAFIAGATTELIFRLLIMPKLGLAPEIGECRRRCRIIANSPMEQVLALFASRPHLRRGPPLLPMPAPDYEAAVPALTPSESRRIIRHVARGNLSKAAAVVKSEACVAPITPDTLAKLRELHPVGVVDPFGQQAGSLVQNIGANVVGEHLDTIVRMLHAHTSPGISGWSTPLIRSCYRGGGPFRQFLIKLSQQVRMGATVGRILLLACRLTPLQPDPDQAKIRPIANGEMLLKVCLKVGLKTLVTGRELLPCQLGVGSPGGVEPITHFAELVAASNQPGALPQGLEPVFSHVYSLDIRNAFNTANRQAAAEQIREHAPKLFRLAKFCYGQPAPLVVNDNGNIILLESSDGFRQGSPEASLLFSIALRPKIRALQNLYIQGVPRVLPVAYADDISVFIRGEGHMDSLKTVFAPIIPGQRPSDGFELNEAKCKEHCFASLHNDNTGMEILGAMVGTNNARMQFIAKRKQQLKWQLVRLHTLPKQVALLLLTQCLSRQLPHLLRTMDTRELEEVLCSVDSMVFATAERIRDANTYIPPNVAQRIYSLPQALGGFGLLSMRELRDAARTAARSAALLQMRVMGLPMVFDQLPEPTLAANDPLPPTPPRQRTLVRAILVPAAEALLSTLVPEARNVFVDNASKIGSAWLRARPCEKYRQLSDDAVASAMSLRLLQPNPLHGADCPFCQQPIQLPLHRECCAHAPPFAQARHKVICSLIGHAVKQSNPDCHILYSPVVFNQPNQPLRSADLRVRTGANGDRYLDFKCVSIEAADKRAAIANGRARLAEAQVAANNAAAPANGAHAVIAAGGNGEADGAVVPAEEAAPAVEIAIDAEPMAGGEEPPPATAAAAPADDEVATQIIPDAADASFVTDVMDPIADIAADGPANVAAPPADALNPEVSNQPLRSIAWREIEWALAYEARKCNQHYGQFHLPMPVIPFVISSGGTLDKTSFELLKGLIPEKDDRRELYTNMSIALVRARTRAYGSVVTW